MVESLIALLFYVFTVAGSVSLSYLVLRLVYPEIRTFDSTTKLATVVIVGIAITVSALAVDYAANGEAKLLALDSAFMLIMFAVTLVYFIVLRVFFLLTASRRKFVTVGIPIAASAKQLASTSPKGKPAPPKPLETPVSQPQTYVEKVQQRAAAQASGTKPVAKPIERKETEEAEIEALLKTVKVEATQQAISEAGPVHRRYLLNKEQAAASAAASRSSSKEEFGLMVQDIYSQLKETSASPKVTDVLKVDAPSEPAKQASVATEATPPIGAIKKPESGVSMSDILGTDIFTGQKKQAPQVEPQQQGSELFAPEGTPSQGNDIFAQLSKAAGEAPPAQAQQPVEQKTEAAKSDVSFVQLPAEKGVSCPTCHSKNSKIIFCPYCGAGMCANCSPSVKPVGPGQFVYVCPKCSEEVSVKKKTD